VQNLSAIVEEDDEDVEDLEAQRGHRKEIHRYHLSEVIAQESSPLLVKDGVRLEDPKRSFLSFPGVGEPDPKRPVQWPQPRSVGTATQEEQWVAKSQVLKDQVPAGFQSRYREVKSESQPTNHEAEDSGKCLRSVF
jgi:hypothetical protein